MTCSDTDFGVLDLRQGELGDRSLRAATKQLSWNTPHLMKDAVGCDVVPLAVHHEDSIGCRVERRRQHREGVARSQLFSASRVVLRPVGHVAHDGQESTVVGS